MNQIIYDIVDRIEFETMANYCSFEEVADFFFEQAKIKGISFDIFKKIDLLRMINEYVYQLHSYQGEYE